MDEVAISPFAAWESFYVIVGSSAGALTGLQFVVIALIAEKQALRTSREIDAFGTPTVVHFCVVLLMSAILSAPWGRPATAGLMLGALGLAGIGYTGIVVRRARQQTGYKPVFEDWLWHAMLPLVAYAGLLGAGLAVGDKPLPALFVIGSVSLLLLFIGIHNSWDTVTYVAVGNSDRTGGQGELG